MDAGTSFEIDIKPGSRDRHLTVAPANLTSVTADIFKKTSSVADSKRGGRDVAKDMFQVGGMPLRKHRQAGSAMDDAVGHRGGAREK